MRKALQMNEYSYAWEKFHLAVQCLASGTDPLPQRLRDAWMPSLGSLWSPTHIPDAHLYARLKVLKRDLAPADGCLIAETLPENEQRRMANEICSLYDEVCRRRAIEQSGPEATPANPNISQPTHRTSVDYPMAMETSAAL
jgi:hypothetical protein